LGLEVDLVGVLLSVLFFLALKIWLICGCPGIGVGMVSVVRWEGGVALSVDKLELDSGFLSL